jgi:hypothetical protein
MWALDPDRLSTIKSLVQKEHHSLSSLKAIPLFNVKRRYHQPKQEKRGRRFNRFMKRQSTVLGNAAALQYDTQDDKVECYFRGALTDSCRPLGVVAVEQGEVSSYG